MPLKDWLQNKNALQTPLVEDPFWGPLRAEPPDLWVASRYFHGADREINVLLQAGPEGPAEAQKEFYRQVEARYPDVVLQFEQVFVADYDPYPGEIAPERFFRSLQLQAILLPPIEGGATLWELIYTSDSDDAQVFTLVMKDFEYHDLRLDD